MCVYAYLCVFMVQVQARTYSYTILHKVHDMHDVVRNMAYRYMKWMHIIPQ